MAMKKLAAVSGETNAAVLNERVRISAILESPEGKKNPELATVLALRQGMDVESARDILARAPAANPYLAAMDREGPIGLSSATADFTNDPKAARMKELSESVSSFNTEKGYTPAKVRG